MPHSSPASRVMLPLLLLLSSIAVGQQAKQTSHSSPGARSLVSAESSEPGGAIRRDADAAAATPAQPTADIPSPQNDVVIRGGTILTVTHGKIENGSIYIHNGKIAAIGKTVDAPSCGSAAVDSRLPRLL